jgi:predicted nucleotidyltransferase
VNDIDLLVVVPNISYIENVRTELMAITNVNLSNSVHVTIYTNTEYLNDENKFSYKKVNHEITYEDMLDLYKLRLTTAST